MIRNAIPWSPWSHIQKLAFEVKEIVIPTQRKSVKFALLRQIVIAGLVSFLMLACANKTIRQPAADESIHIGLIQTEADRWRLIYELPMMASRVYFQRTNNIFRTKMLRSVDSEIVLGVDGINEYFERKDGRPFKSAEFSLKPYFDNLERDYKFSLSFGDGSCALYTGHLDVGYVKDQSPPQDYQFEALTGLNLVFNGQSFTRPQHWQPSDPIRSTYVYFGGVSPVVSPHLTILKDPALPHWLQSISDYQPARIFEHYETEFGFRPARRPYVIINSGDLSDPRMDRMSGGSAPGWIQFGINGGKWKNEVPILRERFLFLIAHEGMHQFQGAEHKEFAKVGWLNEGSADFFAYRAIRSLKLISDTELKQADADAINECLDRWNKTPIALDKPLPTTDFRVVYVCGRTLHVAVDTILRKNGVDGMPELWRRLRSTAREDLFNPDDYFVFLKELSGESNFASMAKEFVTKPPKLARQSVLRLLRSAGVNYALQKGLNGNSRIYLP